MVSTGITAGASVSLSQNTTLKITASPANTGATDGTDASEEDGSHHLAAMVNTFLKPAGAASTIAGARSLEAAAATSTGLEKCAGASITQSGPEDRLNAKGDEATTDAEEVVQTAGNSSARQATTGVR